MWKAIFIFTMIFVGVDSLAARENCRSRECRREKAPDLYDQNAQMLRQRCYYPYGKKSCRHKGKRYYRQCGPTR